MVLQVMSPAIREIAPERKRDDKWLWSTTNCSTEDGEQAFPFFAVTIRESQ
jgi:hypothetical protein